MALNPEVLAGKGTNVNDSEHVGRVGLDGDSQVLSLIHERRLGYRLSTSRVVLGQESRKKSGHLVMVPVREGQDKFMVNLLSVRELGVVDDEGTAKTIRILRIVVRVVPVCAGLVNLLISVKMLSNLDQ